MSASGLEFQSRLARVEDAFKIMQLYHEVYEGTYPEPLMRNFQMIEKFVSTPSNFWFVAESQGKLVGSVIVRHDDENRLAKAGAAVVVSSFRKIGLMEQLLAYGIDYVKAHTSGVDITYATTRTVHEGAQALTEKLGFKKLGIFPNAHKSVEVETHCLTALFSKDTLKKRQTPYYLHHRLKDFFEIVSEELPEMAALELIEPKAPTRSLVAPPILEIIDSEHFVRHRFERLKQEHKLQFTFFPFHEPNLLVSSPDQATEVFCFHSKEDGHTVIIGGKAPDNVDYTQFLNKTTQLLRDHRARYIEILIRADKPKIIESILKAKFIPSAFFPAFQLSGETRYDYIVMSKTFEMFDFQNIRLKGLNQKYLEAYYDQWKQTSLNPFLLDAKPEMSGLKIEKAHWSEPARPSEIQSN
jgi:RimJ/RimL family protein N-acetyltransferase